MKIAFLTDTFSRRTGSIQRVLPKYLARCGAEVYVITMDLSPYHEDGAFRGFVEPLVKGETDHMDGFKLYVVGHESLLGYPRMAGLRKILALHRPDVVQCQQAIGWIPLDAARLKSSFGYKLFTGNHNAMSTSRSVLGIGGSALQRGKSFLTRYLAGRIASYATERCYAVTSDCAEIAWRYYGVQKHKVEIMHLGVDTDFFYPVAKTQTPAERSAMRKELDFGAEDIVCVYSGKMTEEKNPRILALAVNRLRAMGFAYSGLFIGDGVQRKAIQSMGFCRVVDFMHFSKLGACFRATDIGVWPTNESSSMLDAAACGIPIIISDGVVYREHVDGNGLVYRMNDLDDLVAKLLALKSPQQRAQLGRVGAEKMKRDFSWESVARRRIAHYCEALQLADLTNSSSGSAAIANSAPRDSCF